MIINPGFKPKREKSERLPPGQYETEDFPVLSLGPTPSLRESDWHLEITGLVEKPLKFNWEEFNRLPMVKVETDIHCVTKWSKFGTHWQGVTIDYLATLAQVKPEARFLVAHSSDGYSTNIPLEETRGEKNIVAVSYEDKPLTPEHGGPARLLIPKLYFWKSAKWLNKLEFVPEDEPGFWETRGYHNHGDPWQEERYSDF